MGAAMIVVHEQNARLETYEVSLPESDTLSAAVVSEWKAGVSRAAGLSRLRYRVHLECALGAWVARRFVQSAT